jgi:hypothetical protein
VAQTGRNDQKAILGGSPKPQAIIILDTVRGMRVVETGGLKNQCAGKVDASATDWKHAELSRCSSKEIVDL